MIRSILLMIFSRAKIQKRLMGTNPRGPLDANCAVISVAPFPSADRFNPQYDFAEAQGIIPMLRGHVMQLADAASCSQ